MRMGTVISVDIKIIRKENMAKETCNSCDQMKKENSMVRKALMETNKNYVEVINENLALRREIEKLRKDRNNA